MQFGTFAMLASAAARPDVSSNRKPTNGQRTRDAQPQLRPPPGANVAEFTVSELSGAIKRALEEGFGYVRLRGEISGYRGPHASGHCYFALKDDKAKIEAVIWKGIFGRLQGQARGGHGGHRPGARHDAIPARRNIRSSSRAWSRPALGALMALLEERKRKLAAEGLFDEARKKPRPFLPQRRRHHHLADRRRHPRHAARLRRALPDARHRLAGARAGRDVRGRGGGRHRAASTRLQPGGRIPRPDVLIVARGGGSLEDLWGFNEEIVVRAVAASRIPVISAVGHETDWTLIDLVADARAPTPTKAAEWAVPKYRRARREHGEVRRCASRTAARRVLAAGARAPEGRRARPAAAGGSRRPAAPALRCLREAARRARCSPTRAPITRAMRASPRGCARRRSRQRIVGLRRAARRAAGARRPGAAQSRSPRAGASSTATASCSPRSATRACCSAASRWCAMPTGAWCARPRPCTPGDRARARVPRRPRRRRGARRRARAGAGEAAAASRPPQTPAPPACAARGGRGGSSQGSLF